MNTITGLLIEDSASDAILFKEKLKDVIEFDIEIDHALTLAQGIERLNVKAYQSVILDLGLPDCIGVACYERLKEHASDIPIIILTGNSDSGVRAAALRRGADNYLIKEKADGNRIAIAILCAIRNRESS